MLLRALEPEDLELLYNIENDPEMWDVGCEATPYSHHALRQHIRLMGASLEESGELRLVIENEGEAVGLIDLTHYDARAQRAEVSIALLRSRRGLGLGQQALSQLEAYVRRFTHLHQLYALVPLHNEPSMQLFGRAEYQHVFDISDWHFCDGEYQKVAFFQKILKKTPK